MSVVVFMFNLVRMVVMVSGWVMYGLLFLCNWPRWYFLVML